MRTIELAGAVGSGKTTLAPQLVRMLAEAGIDAVGQADALAALVSRRVGLSVDAPRGAAFAATHPRLVALVARQLARAMVDRSHLRRIAGLVLRLGARRNFLESRLPPERVVVIDEGFVQRAVNVFAWLPGRLPRRDLARYLALAPVADVVVLVEADLRTAGDRARARGLPGRVAAKSPAEAERFLARAAEVVAVAGRVLEVRGVPVIRVGNDGPPEAALATLRAHLPDLVAPPRPPNARLEPFGVPRLRRPSPPAVAPDGLATAMHLLGVDDWRLVRPLGRATGRSGSAIVVTPNEQIVVKRYKASVPIEQVRIEHQILRALEARRFPAPRLRGRADGTTVIDSGSAIFAAFRYVDGYRRSDDRLSPPWSGRRPERLHGEALGALHAALEGFVPDASSPHGVEVTAPAHRLRDLAWHLDLLDRVEASPRAGMVRGELGELRRMLPASDDRVGASELMVGTVHGDFGPYNVLVRNGAPLLIVDYELARLDWRVVDLATALPRYAGRGPGVERRIGEFLEGYRSRVSLAAKEFQAIPDVLAFLSLRRAAVLLSRWAELGGAPARAEVGEKLMLARTIGTGEHVIARAVRP